MKRYLYFIFVITLFISCCELEKKERHYKSENIIIIVVDGARYSETWGDSSHQYIKYLANEMADEGVIYTNFYNKGETKTIPGHTAITTGHYQRIDNTGAELPGRASLFQIWRQQYSQNSKRAWIITNKSKLEVLSNCEYPEWKDSFIPSTACGKSGLGGTDMSDSLTCVKSLDILSNYHPKLMLINFAEVDKRGHANDWEGYIDAIQKSDEYIYQIWNYINSDIMYKDKTTLFVTNDHGRHLDSIADGYISHGCNCEGCRHLLLYAFGPDFMKGEIIDTPRELIDITATVSEILHIDTVLGYGEILTELFIDSEVLVKK